MPSRNRDTLKYFFSDGAMPSSDMFADLIDSMLNMDDEGFSKTDINGLEISNLGDSENLISFFKQSNPNQAQWKIRFDNNANSLVISRAEDGVVEENSQANYLLNLSAENGKVKIGVGTDTPEDTLHVNGSVRSYGRRGLAESNYDAPLADGEWHTIAGPFVGCQSLEVVARAKNDLYHRYAMIHAIAMHTISPGKQDIFSLLGLKNRIRYTHAFYESYLHKLKLRWLPDKEFGKYVLQIRSNCDYGADSEIDFHITNLWSDNETFHQDEASIDEA